MNDIPNTGECGQMACCVSFLIDQAIPETRFATKRFWYKSANRHDVEPTVCHQDDSKSRFEQISGPLAGYSEVVQILLPRSTITDA